MKKIIATLLGFVIVFSIVNWSIESAEAGYVSDSVTIEKIRDLGEIDGIYLVNWSDRGGYVAFYVTVYNNQIIQVSEVGYDFWGATVNSAELKIDNPQQATYYFDISNLADYSGVTEYLRVNINSNHELVATFK